MQILLLSWVEKVNKVLVVDFVSFVLDELLLSLNTRIVQLLFTVYFFLFSGRFTFGSD